MKKLNTYIESLLDDEDTFLDPERDKKIIRDWINKNYTINGTLKINDDFTVDCVGGVMVENNKITSLTNGIFHWGAIEGDFFCSGPKLKTLEGGPEWVSGKFSCYKSGKLKSLEGAPKWVGGDFVCGACNKLTSLKGAPKEVGDDFNCSYCKKLTSLEGAPKWVGGDFYCSWCDKLVSLEGAPEKVKGVFDCYQCVNLEITDSDRKKYSIKS